MILQCGLSVFALVLPMELNEPSIRLHTILLDVLVRDLKTIRNIIILHYHQGSTGPS